MIYYLIILCTCHSFRVADYCTLLTKWLFNYTWYHNIFKLSYWFDFHTYNQRAVISLHNAPVKSFQSLTRHIYLYTKKKKKMKYIILYYIDFFVQHVPPPPRWNSSLSTRFVDPSSTQSRVNIPQPHRGFSTIAVSQTRIIWSKIIFTDIRRRSVSGAQ